MALQWCTDHKMQLPCTVEKNRNNKIEHQRSIKIHRAWAKGNEYSLPWEQMTINGLEQSQSKAWNKSGLK